MSDTSTIPYCLSPKGENAFLIMQSSAIEGMKSGERQGGKDVQ